MQSEVNKTVSNVESHDESNIFKNKEYNTNEQVSTTNSMHEDKSKEVVTGLKREGQKGIECTSDNESSVNDVKNAQKSPQNSKEKVNDSPGNTVFVDVIQEEEPNASFNVIRKQEPNASLDVVQEEQNEYFDVIQEEQNASINIIQEEHITSINVIQKEQQNASVDDIQDEEPNASFDVIPDEMQNEPEKDIREGGQMPLHKSDESLFRNLHLVMNQVDENC